VSHAGFVLHPDAAQDILDIWDYIASESAAAADRFREELQRSIESLAAFPHRGFRRTDLTSRPVRFIPLGQYLIAYAPEHNPVLVLAVLHGRRHPRVMAAILSGRR
jgi:toxin ParE1/3/4